jgi:hypothetical protein
MGGDAPIRPSTWASQLMSLAVSAKAMACFFSLA